MRLEIAPELTPYYLATILNFVEALVVAGVVYWRNRNQFTGTIWGLASLGFGIWCLGFSQYFRPLPEETALFWARLTLSAAIINTAFYFHGMCELVGESDSFRLAIRICYGLCIGFILLSWFGPLIEGIRSWTYLDHYVRYNQWMYPWLSLHLAAWPCYAAWRLIRAIRRLVGYKRNQVIYFLLATGIIYLSTTLIIVLIQYEVAIPPVCFYALPFNLALLAYVLAKTRLMEFNLAIEKALVFATAILIVLLPSMVALGVVNVIQPQFLSAPQMSFLALVIVLITTAQAFILPRLGPRAEQAIHTRLFGDRYRYQQALSDLIGRLSTIPTAEELLQQIVDSVVELMGVPRALILMREETTQNFSLRARVGAPPGGSNGAFLADHSEVVRWLQGNRRSLVREELQFREMIPRMRRITAELDALGVSLCVPMILDGRLVGILALENKVSGEMFGDQDIRLLEALCAEAALIERYRRFEQQMFQASKLASLGTLAAGIAHEIRNPLSSIKTFVQLLPSRAGDPEFQSQFVHLVSSDVERINRIVENVLSFARSASVNRVVQPLEPILDDALALMKSRFRNKNVEVVKQWNLVPPVAVDKDQMAQVFVNLLLNAADAVPDKGGRITITSAVTTPESPRGESRRKKPHVTIEIANNGPPIPDAIRERIFDPFFTTKPNGTGLGLSITHKVIEAHNGFITLNTGEDKGTAFQVHLPVE